MRAFQSAHLQAMARMISMKPKNYKQEGVSKNLEKTILFKEKLDGHQEISWGDSNSAEEDVLHNQSKLLDAWPNLNSQEPRQRGPWAGADVAWEVRVFLLLHLASVAPIRRNQNFAFGKPSLFLARFPCDAEYFSPIHKARRTALGELLSN